MRRAAAATILVAWGLAHLASAQPAPTAEEQAVLQQTLRRYGAERTNEGSWVVTPGAVAERMASHSPTTILDVRPAGQPGARIDGSRQVPLAELLASGGRIEWDRKSTVVVVDAAGPEAVEAMVLLRLAGVRAVAMSGGLAALQAELTRKGLAAPPGKEPGGSPTDSTASLQAGFTSQPAPQARSLPTSMLIAVGVPLLALVALLLHFLVLVPRRKRRPLLEALEIIAGDASPRFPEAAELLGRALTSGLRPADLEEARFALGYVRVRLGQYTEASAVVADLPSERQEVVYLNLWLCVRRKEYEAAERLYEQHARLLGDYLHTRDLAGVVFLSRARQLLESDTDRALYYFDRLRKLGVLKDKLPTDIEDHQVVLGIEALFEKSFPEARKRFSEARTAAEREHKPTLHADLGLLLCEWRESDRPDIDERLSAVVGSLQKAQADLGAAPDERGEPGEKVRLLRGVFLWHAVSLLFSWLRHPAKSGLPAEQRQELETRLARVAQVDPRMSDPQLLLGLIGYFFAADQDDRHTALELLDQTTRSQVHLPEVHLLVERERKVAEAEKKSLDTFLALVRHYLADRGVPLELRQQLRERLERFSRFRTLGDEIVLEEAEEEAAASVRDLNSRGEVTYRRVQTIVKSRLAKEAPETSRPIEGLLEQLRQTTADLTRTAEGLERTEQQLMAVTGEFLLDEEEKPPAETGGTT
jgi:rhodanese-related sulfurtransferase